MIVLDQFDRVHLLLGFRHDDLSFYLTAMPLCGPVPPARLSPATDNTALSGLTSGLGVRFPGKNGGSDGKTSDRQSGKDEGLKLSLKTAGGRKMRAGKSGRRLGTAA